MNLTKRWKLLYAAVMAGGMIGLGGAVYLGSGRTVAGACLFAVGLFTICSWGMALYTGQIGYLIVRGRGALPELATVWLGNLIGALCMGGALRLTNPAFASLAAGMTQAKLAQTPVQTAVLGVCCGLLMYIAVDHFRNKTGMSRYLGIFVCVPSFILAGFEHVVADMFYFALGASAAQLPAALGFLAVCTLGNSLGAWLIPLWQRMAG